MKAMSEIVTIKSLWGLCTEPWDYEFGQQEILLGLFRQAVAIADNSSD
jgi:hypothetical protein